MHTVLNCKPMSNFQSLIFDLQPEIADDDSIVTDRR